MYACTMYINYFHLNIESMIHHKEIRAFVYALNLKKAMIPYILGMYINYFHLDIESMIHHKEIRAFVYALNLKKKR